MKRLTLKSEVLAPQKSKKIISFLSIAFVAFFVLEVWLVNRLSTYGNEIQKIQDAKAAISLENQIHENQIAEQTSLNNIEAKANSLGFSSIKNVEYIRPQMVASVNK